MDIGYLSEEKSRFASFWESSSLIDKWMIAVLAIATISNLVAPFVMQINGSDSRNNLQWISGFAAAFEHGDVYPRWLTDYFRGMGAPVFYFYPPLPFFTVGILHVIIPALTTEGLFHAAGLIASITSLLATFIAFKMISPNKIRAFIGALLFSFAPYQFFGLYWRNGLSEHFGMGFVPLVFVCIYRLITESQIHSRIIARLAFSWAGILFSNVPLALVVGISLLVFAFVIARHQPFTRVIVVIYALVLGVIITSLYILPLIAFKSYSQLDQVRKSGGGGGNPSYALSMLMHGEMLTLSVQDLFLIVISIVLFVAYFKTIRIRFTPHASLDAAPNQALSDLRLLRGLLVINACILFLEIPGLTNAIWRVVPFSVIQFAHRFDVILMVTFCTFWIICNAPQVRQLLAWFALIWCIHSAALALFYEFNIHINSQIAHTDNFAPEYMTIYANSDWHIVDYQIKQHEHDPFVLATPMLEPDESISIQKPAPSVFIVHAKIIQQHTLTFHQFAWPAFLLSVRDSIITTKPDSIGRITASLGPGVYDAKLFIKTSSSEYLGAILSLIGILMVFFNKRILSVIERRDQSRTARRIDKA